MEHNERRIVGIGAGRVGRGQSCWTFELVSGIWVVIEKQDSVHTHACMYTHTIIILVKREAMEGVTVGEH